MVVGILTSPVTNGPINLTSVLWAHAPSSQHVYLHSTKTTILPWREFLLTKPRHSYQCKSLSVVWQPCTFYSRHTPTTPIVWKQHWVLRAVSGCPHLQHFITLGLSTCPRLTGKAMRAVISDLWPASAVGFTEVITKHLIFYKERRQKALTNQLNLSALYCFQEKKHHTYSRWKTHTGPRQLLGQCTEIRKHKTEASCKDHFGFQ